MKKTVQTGYNKVAGEYLKDRDQFKNNHYLDRLIAVLPKGSRILDIGCGAGVPIDSYLIENGYRVHGIDISEKQTALARKHLPTGTFDVRDMSAVTAGDYSVDAVISFYAIFHIPRETHKKLLTKIHSFLSPNGYLLITMGASDWVGEEDFHGVNMAWSHYDAQTNKKIINDAGFEILFFEIDTSGEERHLVVLAKKIPSIA